MHTVSGFKGKMQYIDCPKSSSKKTGMSEDLLNDIKLFTLEQAGIDPNDITESAYLEKDLGIYGDDAVEYIIAFGKAFNVDVSKFMAAYYFSGEGISFSKKRQEKKELSITHLIKAIKAGRLDEEVINS
jgi:alcohol dehydrogenase YqhD (iron-dependent ADH family)